MTGRRSRGASRATVLFLVRDPISIPLLWGFFPSYVCKSSEVARASGAVRNEPGARDKHLSGLQDNSGAREASYMGDELNRTDIKGI